MSDSVTPWIVARQGFPSITNSQSSLKLTSIKSVMPSSHLILCRPLLLLPPIPPSIRVFSNESTLHMRWPQYWSFSFSISPSKEHPGLISFRMDWLDLFAVQGTVKSLLHTTVQKHQFFGTQLSSQSNSHIHTWPLEKTIALIRQTFVGKVMSLLLNMLSRLVITFLPMSKHLLISRLQSPSAVILEPPKISHQLYNKGKGKVFHLKEEGHCFEREVILKIFDNQYGMSLTHMNKDTSWSSVPLSGFLLCLGGVLKVNFSHLHQ